MLRQVPAVIDDRPLSADRVPTLTEVVELDLPATPLAAAGDAPDGVDADAVAVAPSLDVEHGAEALADPIEGVYGAEDVLAAVADTDAVTRDEAGVMLAADAVDDTDLPLAPADTPAESEAQQPAPLSAAPAPAMPVDADAIVGQVLAELMPRVDMLLESRLREALAPALARAADGLIRDTRADLAVAMRDLVQEAVDRVVQRRAER